MIRTAFPMSCLLALAAHAAPCRPDAALIEQDRRYEDALRRADVAYLENWLADDYVWVHNLAVQTENRAQLLGRLARQRVSMTSRTTGDVQAHASGDTVVLRGLSSVQQFNPDGSASRVNRYRFLRTYVTVAGECRLLAVQTMKVFSGPAE
ncbi:nuclear transport factor 2 family protein [Pseudoduganella plicata]|nr:nuclear transport factor 2 family protein [Pseudoduganella plicata]